LTGKGQDLSSFSDLGNFAMRVLALFAALFLAGPAMAAPDLIVVGAKVFTADPARPYAEAVAVEDGAFVAVGADAEIRKLAGPNTRVIDAGGRLVVPGLNDGHIHVGREPVGRMIEIPGPPFPGPSAEETVAAVAKAAAEHRPGWIFMVTGYPVFNDPRNWRDALDAVAPDNPVMLVGCCGHAMLLNSKAFAVLGIAETVTDPIGGGWGRDAKGRLNGHVVEAAQYLVRRAAAGPDPSGERDAVVVLRTARQYAAWGVTSVGQMANNADLATVKATLDKARPPIRWSVYAWGLPREEVAEAWREVDGDSGAWPPLTRLAGSKWILDGTPLERGALRLDDYADRSGWRGVSNYNDAQLAAILGGALTSPHQLALHISGDGEAQRVFDLMERLAPADRWVARRVRIEHADGVFGPRLAQARRLGVVLLPNPIHIAPMPVENGAILQDARWGPNARAHQPLAAIQKAGVPLALASDGGNGEGVANPFLQILLATTYELRPDEALSREQALTAYTAGAAYAEGQEAVKGAIRPGLAADFAVLSQDVLTVPPPQLPATTSLLTVVGGSVVHADGPFN
jgi:predicted amidohydrolase YtcJ